MLDVAFSGKADQGAKCYSGGLDRQVREIDLASGQQTILGSHNEAVRCVNWSEETNLCITASWDGNLRTWDPRSTPSNNTLHTPLPGKAFSMDVSGNTVIVACAQRHIVIYDVRKLAGEMQQATDKRGQVEPEQKRESSLKFMTRAVRLNPEGNAFASTSIEGRAAVDFVDPSSESQSKKYAFKCHRAVVDGIDTVYPVNALAFHQSHGTFATGGGDGVVSIWDLAAKKRLRQYTKYPSSVTSLSFNCDGTRLAVAGSVFLEEGTPGKDRQNGIWIKSGMMEDAKPKVKA